MCDNCDTLSNSDQEDRDFDGVGDVCDNCRDEYNPEQENSDFPDPPNFSGDACDDDDDGDGLSDLVETGTGIFVNASNTGTNALNPDTDGDGFSDGLEVQAGSNPNSGGDTPPDTDTDGVVNVQDNCTQVPNLGQLDVNHEGFGNICDADVTDDGVVGIPDPPVPMRRETPARSHLL
jgi:hypothetical protein